MTDKIRLGVNIDHVATLRNARGGVHPDPLRAAKLALEAGADGITAHLREDRRHILDTDIRLLKRELRHPLNLEMAATNEMVDIALEVQPHAVCLVPEKREERTTEGGLEVTRHRTVLRGCSARLRDAGIRVSFFVNPSLTQVEAAKTAGAQIVELHTGAYCEAVEDEERKSELARIQQAAEYANALGLECHAGHGLSYDTVAAVAAIPHIVELNIGHFLIGEAVFLGLKEGVTRMRRLMDEARK